MIPRFGALGSHWPTLSDASNVVFLECGVLEAPELGALAGTMHMSHLVNLHNTDMEENSQRARQRRVTADIYSP